jgi:hypothetical protein
MKKISIVTILVLATLVSFSFKGKMGKLFNPIADTFINKQTVGSASTLSVAKGGYRADSALILPPYRFADTTAANWSVVSKYDGSVIKRGAALYFRNLNPNKWILIPASTSATVSWGGITGTLTNQIDLYDTISGRVRYIDTSSMLSYYLRKSDTANMVSPYLRKSDTTTMLVPYLRKFDTTNILSGYALLSGSRPFTGTVTGTMVNMTGATGYQLNGYNTLAYTGNSLVMGGYSAGQWTRVAISVGGDTALTFNSTKYATFLDTMKAKAIVKTGGTSSQILLADGSTIPTSSYGSGTVTSVATNNASGITGGTFTTSGTIAADTSILSTKANVTASLLGKVNISDTASMLSNRLKISDTSTMLSGYALLSGSRPFTGTVTGTKINMTGGVAYQVNGYNTINYVGNTLQLGGNSIGQWTNLVVNVGGDSALTFNANKYANFVDTVKAKAFVKLSGTSSQILLADGSTIPTSSYGTGTVTSVATNNGSGITGGTFTTSGTIAADTTVLSTKANVTASLLGKLNISDTATMKATQTLDYVLGKGNVSGRSFTSGVPTFWGVTSGTATTDSILMISTAVTKKVSANSYIWNSTSGQSSVFNNTNPTTSFSASASLYGGISTASITSGGGTQSAQYGNVGLWGQIGLGNTTSITANANSFFSGLHGDAYKRDAGNLVGTISAVSGRLLMNGSATTDNGYSFRAMTPIQEPAGTWTGTLTSGGGIIIDAIRGTTNVTTGGRFITARSIYAVGTTDTAEFVGYLKVGGTIQGTLSTAAQTNVTSLGTLSSLNVTGTSTLGVVNMGTNALTSGTISSGDITTNGNNKGIYFNGTRNAVLGSNAADEVYIAAANATKLTAGSAGITINGIGTGTVQATAGLLSVISDSKYKNKGGLFKGNAYEDLMRIPKPEYWSYNDNSGYPNDVKKVKQFGLFADSVYNVLGEEFAPSQPQSQKDSLSGVVNHSLSDRALLSLFIQAFQEFAAKKEKEVADLNTKYEALLQRVTKLENK